MGQGIDLRIPTFNGKAKQLDLVVSNDGGQEFLSIIIPKTG